MRLLARLEYEPVSCCILVLQFPAIALDHAAPFGDAVSHSKHGKEAAQKQCQITILRINEISEMAVVCGEELERPHAAHQGFALVTAAGMVLYLGIGKSETELRRFGHRHWPYPRPRPRM